MNNGGIAIKLVNFANLLAGKLPGSLAHTNVIGNMLFGSISGSGTAAAAAELITRQGGNVAGFNFVINLAFLKGSENLVKYSDNIHAILEY